MKHFFAKLKYSFENSLSKGIGSLIGWLFLLTVIVVLSVTFFVWTFNLAVDNSFIEQFWAFLLSTIGADAVHDTTWLYRLFYLFIVFTGIFVTSILISILTQMIHEKVEDLKKGKSKVIEKNHTIILGWSPKIFTIIEELVTTNHDEGNKKSCVVIMSMEDNTKMEDEIRHTITNLYSTKIVCRTGDSTVKLDLEKLSIENAKSVIIIASRNNTSDSEIIKTLLAIKGVFVEFPPIVNPQQKAIKKTQTYGPSIVAEIYDEKNTKLVEIISEKKALFINIDEFSARIIAQTSNQPGLPEVYVELLNFESGEIYTIPNPEKTVFKELLLRYENNSVIGYIKKTEEKICLNPEGKTTISDSDEIILIAENDPANKQETKEIAATDTRQKQASNKSGKLIAKKLIQSDKCKDNILILGWNSKIWTIIKELDSYVEENSNLKIISDNINSDKLDAQNLNEFKKFNTSIDLHDYADYNYLEDKYSNKELGKRINKYLEEKRDNKKKFVDTDFENFLEDERFKDYLRNNDFKQYLSKHQGRTTFGDEESENIAFAKYLKDENFKNYTKIVILSDERLGSQEADLKNIACLLYLRDIEAKILKHENISLYIVCELINEKNQRLVNKHSNNDFIISSRLTSLFLAQISEDPNRYHIFKQLFDDDGAEVYFRDAKKYFEVNQEYKYADIVAHMSIHYNETVIGYRKYKHRDDEKAGIVINPGKLNNIHFAENDQVIVIADEKDSKYIENENK